MLCIWCDWNSIVHYEFIYQKQTLNSDNYCSQLDRLKKAIDEMYPELTNWIVSFPSGKCHTSRSFEDPAEISIYALLHTPYSHDIALLWEVIFVNTHERKWGKECNYIGIGVIDVLDSAVVAAVWPRDEGRNVCFQCSKDGYKAYRVARRANIVFCLLVGYGGRSIINLTTLDSVNFRSVYVHICWSTLASQSVAPLYPGCKNFLFGWSNYGFVSLVIFIIRLLFFFFLFTNCTYLFLYQHTFGLSFISILTKLS